MGKSPVEYPGDTDVTTNVIEVDPEVTEGPGGTPVKLVVEPPLSDEIKATTNCSKEPGANIKLSKEAKDNCPVGTIPASMGISFIH